MKEIVSQYFEKLLLTLLAMTVLGVAYLAKRQFNLEFMLGVLSLVSTTAGLLTYRILNRRRILASQQEAERLVATAKREADTIRREAEVTAKSEILAAREQFDKQSVEKRRDLEDHDKRLIAREASLQEKLETLIRREEELRESELKLADRHRETERFKNDVQALVQQQQTELQRVASLSREEARHTVLQRVESEMRDETGAMVRRMIEHAREVADREAKRIVAIAIERYTGQHVSDTTTTTVTLPGEEMKGRIIGREGRNIRAFEAATGVTPIIDDTPGVVVLSSFDPVRREVARIALGQLVTDGRIHPARIEEVVLKVQSEMEETIRQAGEDATVRAGVGHVEPEIVKVLGRLKFRHSYAQNVLDHSIEVAQLVGSIASELGLNVQLAKRVALFHDIGKAIDHEVQGSHAAVGADLLRRHGEPDEVVVGVASHHEDVAPNIYGILTSACDAISASRAGARSESAEIYLQRLEKLETIANSFPGVAHSYAIQAGREIRVAVEPDKIGDNATALLARDIARRIEAEMQFPGQIKVTVLRETRVVEYAK